MSTKDELEVARKVFVQPQQGAETPAMADDTPTLEQLKQKVMRHFDDPDTRLAEMAADVDALIAKVRAEWRPLLIDADSMLSAYGHGRVITKEEALELSTRCRKMYEQR